MEGSSVTVTRLYCVLFFTIIKAVISTGLGKCPVYPPLPNFDIQRDQRPIDDVRHRHPEPQRVLDLPLQAQQPRAVHHRPTTAGRRGLPRAVHGLRAVRHRVVVYQHHIWVLGRRREIEAPVRAQIYAIMEELHLDPDRLIISKNNNCTDIADNKV